MTRMHIHVGVDNIDSSVKFYSALFGAEPAKVMPDYAKWMLDDPNINFAISTRVETKGVDHLGIQVEDEAALAKVRERIQQADISTFDEGATVCSYAESEKSWVRDPAGIAWEAYHTMADAEIFTQQVSSEERACCVPSTDDNSSCCSSESVIQIRRK